MFKNFNELVDGALKIGTYCDMEGAFCSQDEDLIFVHQETICMVPWSRTALQILHDAGFKRQKFQYIPDRTIPKSKRDYWNNLIKEAHEEKPV